MPRESKRPGTERSRRFYITLGLVAVAIVVGLFAVLNQSGLNNPAGIETDSALSTSTVYTPTPPPTETSALPPSTETPSLPTSTSTPSPTFTIPPTVSVAPPPAGASAGEVWTSPSDGMVLVFVPAGEFL